MFDGALDPSQHLVEQR